jgi:hypothetical protein
MRLYTLFLAVVFLNYGELAINKNSDIEVIDLYCNFEAFDEG